jgi:Tfp pilus assembly major pilin PilA
MNPLSIEDIIENGDPEALRLMSDVLQKQLDYREAWRKLRAHLGGTLPVPVPAPPRPTGTHPVGVLNPESISQRCLKVVKDAAGENVTTETIAAAVGVDVEQVRGALKRFVQLKTVLKPRRGYWRFDVGKLNGQVKTE